MSKKLVLVDIDDFLIRNSIALNKHAIQAVFRNKFAINLWNRIDYLGTDSQVFNTINETFELNLNVDELSTLKLQYVFSFINMLRRGQQIEIEKEHFLLIKELAKKPSIIIGTISRSFFDIARAKLVPLNIFHIFQEGAFGEDAGTIDDLLLKGKKYFEKNETFSSFNYFSNKDLNSTLFERF